MEYRVFGRTGMKVSPFCLGCMNFGRRTTPEDSYPIIDRALDAGINFLDTANVYDPRRQRGDYRRGFKAQRPAQPHRTGHKGPRQDG